jgi:hypothetical protein
MLTPSCMKCKWSISRFCRSESNAERHAEGYRSQRLERKIEIRGMYHIISRHILVPVQGLDVSCGMYLCLIINCTSWELSEGGKPE